MIHRPASLLDTNVISETRRIRPNERVLAFIDGVDDETLFISALTIGELQKGVELKRRNDPVAAMQIADWVEEMQQSYAERICLSASMSPGFGERFRLIAAVRSLTR